MTSEIHRPLRPLVARGRDEPHRVASPLVICCTFLGHWAVLAAGQVSVLTVAVGVTLTARTAAGESRAGTAEPVS